MYMQHYILLKCGFKQASAKSNHIKCSGAGNLILQKKSMAIPSKLHEFINKQIKMCSCNQRIIDTMLDNTKQCYSILHACIGYNFETNKNNFQPFQQPISMLLQISSCLDISLNTNKLGNNDRYECDNTMDLVWMNICP